MHVGRRRAMKRNEVCEKGCRNKSLTEEQKENNCIESHILIPGTDF